MAQEAENFKNQSQEAEKRPEKGPKRPQVGPKTAPRGPKTAREAIFANAPLFFRLFLAPGIPRWGSVRAPPRAPVVRPGPLPRIFHWKILKNLKEFLH